MKTLYLFCFNGKTKVDLIYYKLAKNLVHKFAISYIYLFNFERVMDNIF